MPKDCDSCDFCDYEQGQCSASDHRNTYPRVKGKRPEWCPLVEVAEPHGNLVDISLMSERAKYWDVGFNGISLHDLLQEFMPFAQIQ